MQNNQKGFSGIEALIVILVIAIIAVVGFDVYHNKSASLQNQNSQKNSTKQETSSNVGYVGWKTYNWTAEGLSFKYPPSWITTNPQATTTEEQTNLGLPTKPNGPAVYLSSPTIVSETGFASGSDPSEMTSYTGAFAIDATKDTAANIEQSTDAGNPDGIGAFVYILKVIPFTVHGYKQMYIIEEGETSSSYVDELAITDHTDKIGLSQTSDDDSFQSKSTPADRIDFSIGLFSQANDAPETFSFINMPVNTFENLADYQTAIKILQSITY